jgi:SNF2 family DNA or RNA helicase
MTTTAGGVAIDLGRADTCHVMDETWNPDDQEQLTDRILGAYKLHQVSCFYYRSLNTVEEYIAGVTALKSNLNDIVLDVHRQIAHRNKPRARA